MPLIPKKIAKDDEARNHATAANIQDRCKLSGVNDTIDSAAKELRRTAET